MTGMNTNKTIQMSTQTDTTVITREDVDRVEELIQANKDKRRERMMEEFREIENKSQTNFTR
jgi:hypothetical protein